MMNKERIRKISFPVGLFTLYLGFLYMVLSVQSEELYIKLYFNHIWNSSYYHFMVN